MTEIELISNTLTGHIIVAAKVRETPTQYVLLPEPVRVLERTMKGSPSPFFEKSFHKSHPRFSKNHGWEVGRERGGYGAWMLKSKNDRT